MRRKNILTLTSLSKTSYMPYHVPHYTATAHESSSFSTYLREEDFPILPAMSLLRPWDADKRSKLLFEDSISPWKVSTEPSLNRGAKRRNREMKSSLQNERSIRCVHPGKGKTRAATELEDRCYQKISQFPAESDNFFSTMRLSHATRNFLRDRPEFAFSILARNHNVN